MPCPACGEDHDPQTCIDYDFGGYAESTEADEADDPRFPAEPAS